MDKGKEKDRRAEQEETEVDAPEQGREQDPVEETRDESLPEGEEVEVVEIEEEGRLLEDSIDELEKENEELMDNLVRLKAEFENYRKRMLKEQTRILDSAEAGLVKKLLPTIDNLERALENTPETDETRGLREGVVLVLEQMLDILKKEGLETIDPQGEPFDPEHHEAVMVIETEECPEDTVLEVVQKGYRFNGMLLRPAMVQVSCPRRDSTG